MKKVKMILTNGFGPDVRVYKEAKYLVSEGFNVEILCWDRKSEFIDAEYETADGIFIKRFFPSAEYGTGYRQVGSYFRFIKECKNYLENVNFDYLHCHDLDGIIAGWLMFRKDARLIFDMHEFYEVNGRRRQKLKYLVRALVGFFQSKSDYIIHVNNAQVAPIAKQNLNKLVFLPNYPESSVYRECQKSNSDKLRIAYIGAVRQYNELKNLFDACKGMTDVSVSIHGSGVAYIPLSEIALEYPNVTVTGRYDYSESAQLYSEADLLYVIYPTTSDQYFTSYPVKFFEAIITRTPVIVGENTVLAEFVHSHDIGFVVNGDSVDDVRNLVDELRADRKLLNSKVDNIEKIQFDYLWEHVVSNLNKIYSK